MKENLNMTLQNVMEELAEKCKENDNNTFTHVGKKDGISIEYRLERNEPDENNFMHTIIKCYENGSVLEMTIDAKSMIKDDENVIVYIAYIIDSEFYIIELMPDNVSFVSDLAPIFESAFLQYLQDNIIEIMIERGYTL